MQLEQLKRREFILLLGSASVIWPLAARAQQQQAMPVVGYLCSSKRASLPQREIAFREGLASKGLVEGRNVAIDYQYAENQNDRLPALASELVRRQVDVIYAGENAAVLAAKAATKLIPIVFRIGGDPIQLGLVTSLNRPGGNITGVSFLSTVTGTARLQMLHEAVPNAVVMGLLVNPTNPNAEPDTREAQEAARKLGIDLHVVRASSAQAIDAAFATLVERRAQALVIDGDSFFTDRRQQLASLTTRHALPSIFATRDFPMMLVGIEPSFAGPDLWAFECPMCELAYKVLPEDPMKSNRAAGWLKSELRPPETTKQAATVDRCSLKRATEVASEFVAE